MDFKITIFITFFDKFLIFLFLCFFYLPFFIIGFYLNKKKIINKFFIIPFSFVSSNILYGLIIFIISFLNLEIKRIAFYIIFFIILIYFLSFLFFFKVIRKKIKEILFNLNKLDSFFFSLFSTIFFIAFFSIPAFPDGDAALHISKISKFVNNKFNFFSPFDSNSVDIVYPGSSSYLVFSLISFITKLSPLSVWSFSLVFYLIIDYFALTGFFYWLLSKRLISILFSFFYLLIFRFKVSLMTYPYPNNQNILVFYFILILFFDFFLNKKNKNLFLVLFSLSIFSYQMIHIAMSPVIFFVIFSLYLSIIVYLLIKRTFNLKFNIFFRLKEILNMFIFLILSFIPIIFYVIYLLFFYKLNYYSRIIKIDENTDPFIVNLYKIYTEFNIKNKIIFYFKDLNFDTNFPFFGGYFIHFLFYFLLFIISYKKENYKLLFFALFSFFINLLIFNFGFVSQKILPLWLLMRIDQTNFVIFIVSFLLIYLLFIKILGSKKGYYLYLFLLLFLIFSSIYRLQLSRIYAREFNISYQNCEFYWKQLSKKINFYGRIYVFGGCEYPQYLLNVYTINSRYSPLWKEKSILDYYFSRVLSNDNNLTNDDFKKVKNFLKENINFIVFKDCNYLNKLKRLGNELNFNQIKKIDNSCIIKL